MPGSFVPYKKGAYQLCSPFSFVLLAVPEAVSSHTKVRSISSAMVSFWRELCTGCVKCGKVSDWMISREWQIGCRSQIQLDGIPSSRYTCTPSWVQPCRRDSTTTTSGMARSRQSWSSRTSGLPGPTEWQRTWGGCPRTCLRCRWGAAGTRLTRPGSGPGPLVTHSDIIRLH